MEEKRKILLLPDHIHDHWSAYNRCEYLKRYLSDFADFNIWGGCDKDVYLNQLKIAEAYSFVHLHFTGNLDWYYPLFLEHPEKLLITIINERSLLQGFQINLEKANEMIRGCCGATSVGYHIAEMYPNVEYIPNGVDLTDFHTPKQIVVGYCGTKRKNKNVEILERACFKLGLKLKIAAYEGERIPHNEMWKFYRELDVFVHPSLSEGCSNPILEALAMNVPIICTRQGIVEREFEDLVTFIEPTYESLFAALKRFNTRNRIEEKFQWSSICQKYKNFYKTAYNRQQEMLKVKNER